ncbi:MAG: choline/ethanolamine kinase--aminoglycoside phosphotransferase, partial [Hoeflea sp.]|nr:choline/ethanolamine kinase--aminoglycoside phosphotransferase [Hoeflea sp.]
MMMKSLGSAEQPMENTIEALIREAPLFKGGVGMIYGPVSGGISNENWRVKHTQGAGDWFVKVPGNGTEMFIDRVTAMDASKKAAAAGLGPRVYDDLAGRGVEINDFLPG